MVRIYVFDNSLLGNDGTDFKNALIEAVSFEYEQGALEWFNVCYGWNDYSCSFTPPEGM